MFCCLSRLKCRGVTDSLTVLSVNGGVFDSVTRHPQIANSFLLRLREQQSLAAVGIGTARFGACDLDAMTSLVVHTWPIKDLLLGASFRYMDWLNGDDGLVATVKETLLGFDVIRPDCRRTNKCQLGRHRQPCELACPNRRSGD